MQHPPFCLICHTDGHLTVDYNNRSNPHVLKHYEKGLPGCGFFGLEGGVDVVRAAPTIHNTAVISMQSKEVTLQMISHELREWGLEGWDWQIQ